MTIADTGRNGICCTNGKGSYKIFVDGVEQKSGGEFGTSETTQIGDCSPTSAPTVGSNSSACASDESMVRVEL
eukprot:CAMPEP_0198108140 /NCGR_PEP_ID=MMETSP1442-20131203/230_1 /TAXON_ID= /ORGANISM="Craspedostauros australis, Strain CCMP3328" /LENGTH=72 /DNA_ID=CAMNT_0043763353 /DNA_START=30 /DNA_END=245 /DNA_ORIENTATION=-